MAFGFGISVANARADAPWTNLLTGNRVEADPNKHYTLTDNQGPWTHHGL